jgi:hypothetical protein
LNLNKLPIFLTAWKTGEEEKKGRGGRERGGRKGVRERGRKEDK